MDFAAQNKLATKWLLEYDERRKQYLDKMSEMSYIGAVKYSSQPSGTDISTPCENKAISLANMDDQRLWLMVIEETEKSLNEKKKAFLDARRWAAQQQDTSTAGRPGWVETTQIRYSDWFYRRFNNVSCPDRNTMTKWWAEIVDITVRLAIKRNCL